MLPLLAVTALSFTYLFDKVQLNIPWRLREDFTVPAPHHITSGLCPASHTGHQEPCLITATADSTLSGHPTSRLYPDSEREFMNKADYTHSLSKKLASTVTVNEYNPYIQLFEKSKRSGMYFHKHVVCLKSSSTYNIPDYFFVIIFFYRPVSVGQIHTTRQRWMYIKPLEGASRPSSLMV